MHSRGSMHPRRRWLPSGRRGLVVILRIVVRLTIVRPSWAVVDLVVASSSAVVVVVTPSQRRSAVTSSRPSCLVLDLLHIVAIQSWRWQLDTAKQHRFVGMRAAWHLVVNTASC